MRPLPPAPTAAVSRQRRRSEEPSSRVTVPPPTQTPAMPANGAVCAWLAEPQTVATASAATARISRLATAKGFVVRCWLIAVKLATDRCTVCPLKPHSTLPDPALPLSWPFAYAPSIETRTRPSRPMLPETSAPDAEILPSATVSVELRLRFAAAAVCHNGDIPETVVRGLGKGGRLRPNGESGNKKYGSNPVVAHEIKSPMCVMRWLIRAQCVQNLVHRSNQNCSCVPNT